MQASVSHHGSSIDLFMLGFFKHPDNPVDSRQRVLIVLAMMLSMVFASALNVFPVNPIVVNFRPLFLFVVMLFWVIHRPELFGAWFAFLVGAVSDLLLDTQLGQQAFSAVLATFLLQYLIRESRTINDIQVWMLAALAIMVFNISLLALQYLHGQVIIWRNGLPMLTSIMLWPVVTLVLKRF